MVAGKARSPWADIAGSTLKRKAQASPATILGGLDAVLGGAFGGLAIGMLENLAGGFLGRGMKDIVGFLLIIVVLMVKPYGLFGTRRIERV